MESRAILRVDMGLVTGIMAAATGVFIEDPRILAIWAYQKNIDRSSYETW